ncbi:hypothetical protein [Trueperella pecoris]|uniref:hypothetical protein n=1 Tax=Trueperella pecoris TaxID=2733571 RepID=UPI00186B6D1A|nr:hypothetical protein [Trueperella pecoris]QOQ38542.1 hypothetical protein HLG82_03135 [Trueperella pecoris]
MHRRRKPSQADPRRRREDRPRGSQGRQDRQSHLWPSDDETPVWELVVTAAEGKDMWVTVTAIDGKILANDAIECPSAQDVSVLDIPCEK